MDCSFRCHSMKVEAGCCYAGRCLAGSSIVGAASSSPPPPPATLPRALLDTREVKATTKPGIRDTQTDSLLYESCSSLLNYLRV